MNILNDKYILTSAAVILVIIAMCLLAAPAETENESITGIVTDVRPSDNGNVFFVTDSFGESVKCFTSSPISVGDVCTVSGSFSDDGGILFVSRLVLR